MAECNHDEECQYTPRTLTPTPLPESCLCPGGGGGSTGEGHKYTFKNTGTGWQVLEDNRPIFNYTDKNTDTTYTWQATTEGWLVKDNKGKVVFNYTDKSGENTTYNFEQTDDCGIKVTDNTGKVVFEYKNTCAGTTYTYEQKGADFTVTNDKTGQVVFNYKGTVDTNTTYNFENYKDGFKVTDSEGVVAYIYDPELGKMSDGSYGIDTLLTTVIKGHTTISTGQIMGFTPADLVVGETLVYDGVGSVGVITKDNGDGTYQVTTMTISPGTRQGVRLGSVETAADLPATCADAEAKGWQTPQLGDFAYVTTGGAGDVISEYVITSDTDCNLTWTFSHSFNAGDYQAQSTTAMSGMILTGGAVQGTFGTPIDPKTLVRGVMRNGVLLTPDAQGKVNVIVDDSHIIVNALPTTNIVDKAEYVVIDANQKVTGTWVHDNTGWYQTYAAVTQVKAHQVVTALPTTAIEENVEYVVVDGNKVTGTWVYDPAKGWLQTEVLDKPAHIVVKTLPTTNIDDEAEYIVVDDLTDPVGTFNATYVHTDSGWVKTAEAAKAQAAHIAVTALPTTNINENAEYLVMTDLTDPTTLTGTWVRVNGNWVQTEAMSDGYHLVTALPTTDIDDKHHYVVVGDLANPDTTFLGEFVYDKTANKWIDLKGSTEVTYNIGRDGQELKSADAVIAGGDRFTSISGGQRIPFVNRPNSTIDQEGDGTWIVPPHSKVEVIMSLALYNANGGSEPNGEWCVREVGYTGTDRQDPRYILGVDPYDHRSNANDLPGWSLNRTASGHYTNTTDNPVTIEAVCLSTATAGTQIYNVTSHITVQEIGRIVDPIAYMLNDGNAQEMPVGSLIQTMSNSAPKHYLICDGSEYAIGTYPELEAHFVKEFGSVTHFGAGAAANTYKVPDLRGEFLRMTGENSHINAALGELEGSGAEVGEHQQATAAVNIQQFSSGSMFFLWTGMKKESANTQNADAFSAPTTDGYNAANLSHTDNNDGRLKYFTTRPTNTSVNVAIKCESTPRVIVDQGTYKVTVPFTAAPNSVAVLDVANTEDDSTMVKDNQHLVAPVDGYYVFGQIMSSHGTWNQNFAVDLNDNTSESTHNDGIGASSVWKLKAGDTIRLRSGGSVEQTGKFFFALVNTVTDHKVAELMNKPNLWTPGVEQRFGDGVYGLRLQFTGTASTNQQINLSQYNPGRFIDYGGTITVDAGKTEAMFPCWYSNVANASMWMEKPTKIMHIVRGTQYSKSNDKFDIWMLYTKA